ncbi:MAG TPA: two-component regulator propeller domain-containing protein [Bacteroidota bacterium]|nr:two-component regulator propeller domain-containing protein [Bacteroidota bacterium]
MVSPRTWMYCILLVMFCFARNSAVAQRKSIKQYVHDSWTTANGLPQNGADDILQSRDGYLWFASEEGVSRFDGLEFTVFNKENTPQLEYSWVARLMEDSLGGIWMRCQGVAPGLVRYAGGVFKAYHVQDGLPSDRVLAWAPAPDGTVWIGTDHGAAEWKGTFRKTYTRADGLPSDTVFSLGRDSKGRLWMSTPFGLARLSDGKIEVMSGRADLPEPRILRVNGVPNLFEDRHGTVWMYSRGSAISYANDTFQHFGLESGLPDSVIYCYAEDHSGTIWIGTDRGLGRFSGGKITAIEVSDDPDGNRIREITEDREGSLWLRTDRGVARYAAGKTERYTQRDGLTGDFIQRVFIDKEGSIWTGSSGAGIDRFRDGTFVTYSSRAGLSTDYVHTVLEDRSRTLWIGTADGLDRLKDGVITKFDKKSGLPNTTVRGLAEDADGNLWVTTEGGVCTFRNGAFATRLTADQTRNDRVVPGLLRKSGEFLYVSQNKVMLYRKEHPVPYSPLDQLITGNDAILALFETPDGVLWLTTTNALYQLVNGKLLNLNEAYHLPTVGATMVDQDSSGTYWMSLYGQGLIRYKGTSLVRITPEQGLFDYNVYCFVEDKAGYVWMSCNRGVFRVRKSDLNEVADGQKSKLTCMVYGTADGMESKECNATGLPAAYRTADGRVCFTTVRGLAFVNPDDIHINTLPPPVVIDKFIVEGQMQDTRSVASVPAGKARFEFHYAGLSFIGADQVRYKYRLDGLDKEWFDAGTRRQAFFTNLDPGEYTFHVIAANSDGVWNDAGASVAFVLQPHFYQTRWFLALAVFFFLTSGPSFYFYRMRIMKRRREELEQLVKERTSEVQKTLDNLKDMQNQLILSEKMASLGQLTAGIAHEIKNPLNFITNFAVLSHDLMQDLRKELAAERDRVDPARAKEIGEVLDDLEQNVNKINEHGKRADSIVRGMLLHSRGKAGERLETDLNALLSEYTNLAYHGMRAQDQSFNVKLETNLDPTIGNISVVPQDLSRAFLNIVNNACYAANDKRKSVKNGFNPTVRVTARNLKDRVEIRIWDNGNGIPTSIREKVFNPFFTTKPAGVGTGLGLSLSYDIITQEHKGELALDTKEGEYTEFVITLPRDPEFKGEPKA